MSSLVVVAYPSLYQAEEVRLQLLKMQKEYLVDLEDAVIAVRKADGKVKLHQLYSLTAAGAVGGAERLRQIAGEVMNRVHPPRIR